MKDFLTSPMRKSGSNFGIDALGFAYIQENYDKFCEGINSLKNYELEDQLSENELRFNKQFNEQTQLDYVWWRLNWPV